MNELIELVIRDALWVLLIAGWIFLIVAGLEADKPLSGGLPGHSSADDAVRPREGFADRLGEIGAWLLFGVAALSLPMILWWIFAVHERL